MDECASYAQQMASGLISGSDLAKLVSDGTINKSQRRRIQKEAARFSSGKVTAVEVAVPTSAGTEKKRNLGVGVESEKEVTKKPPSSTTARAPATAAAAESRVNERGGHKQEQEEDEEDEDGGDDEDLDDGDGMELTPKQLKMKTKLLNKELAALAMKKQLTEAKRRLQRGMRKGLKPDVHTWTNLINCHVRCGDIAGAQRVLTDDMPASGVKPNAVTWTTLLKGYGESGDVRAARRILFEELPRATAAMAVTSASSGGGSDESSGAASHARAVFTFLRGCSRTGAVDSAEDALALLPAESNTAAAKAHVASLYCQALRLTDANRLMAALPSAAAAATATATTMDNVSTYLAMGQVLGLLGRLAEASQWSRKARGALIEGKNQTLLQAMKRHSGSGSGGSSMTAAAAVTGTQGSAELFTAHQRAEVEADLNTLDGFINSHLNSKESQQSQSQRTQNSTGKQGSGSGSGSDKLAARLLRQLSQTLVFGYDGRGDLENNTTTTTTANTAAGGGKSKTAVSANGASAPPGTADTTAALLQALREKLGLNSPVFASPSLQALRSAVEGKLAHVLEAHSGHVDFKALFAPLAGDDSSSGGGSGGGSGSAKLVNARELPLKLEVCSGAGDWVARQAHADHGKANWLALELRCDRSCAALRKHLLFSHANGGSSSGGSNLAILSGDASQVVRSRIAPDTITAIFVNHPEPPERSMMVDKREGAGGVSKVQGAHLLTQDFLRDLCRALRAERKDPSAGAGASAVGTADSAETASAGKKRGASGREGSMAAVAVAGNLTIVTDSLPYAKILAESLASMPPVTHAEDSSTGEAQAQAEAEAQAQKRSRGPSGSSQDASRKDGARYVFQSVPLGDAEDHAGGGRAGGGGGDGDSDDEGGNNRGAAQKLELRVAVSSHDIGSSATRLGRSVSANVVNVWRGDIVSAGVRDVISASSYFDRMWSAGNHKRRWFIHVRKVQI